MIDAGSGPEDHYFAGPERGGFFVGVSRTKSVFAIGREVVIPVHNIIKTHV